MSDLIKDINERFRGRITIQSITEVKHKDGDYFDKFNLLYTDGKYSYGTYIFWLNYQELDIHILAAQIEWDYLLQRPSGTPWL